MTCYLTNQGGTVELSNLLTALTWSGDKASAARQVGLSLLHEEDRDWPTPAIGNVVTVAGETGTLFAGYMVRRSLDSESRVMDCVCYDRGIYLRNNDGTYKFRNATPEYIARTVCASRDIPVASLATAGVSIDRKFSAVRLDQIIRTAYCTAPPLWQHTVPHFGGNSYWTAAELSENSHFPLC